MLKMSSTLIDRGVRLYDMILARGKSKGRSFKLTAAACLYIICRENGTDHLLIDFADVFSVKVKPLGRTFLRLCEELKYELPFVDPCLYLHRFARHLGFEKIEEINKTAMRICQRMNRDWMHYGRRPSGICGVALYLAAKLHNEPKTLEEIVKVVRLSTTTVRVRLKEFLRTPSADLSLQQLNRESDANEGLNDVDKVYSSEPCLPPSYTLNRMKDKARETIGINIPLKKRRGNNDEYEAAEDKALTEEIEQLIGGEVDKIMGCKDIDAKPHDLGTLEGKSAKDVGIKKQEFDVENLIDINKMKEDDFSSEEGVDEGEKALGDCSEFDKELDSYFLDGNESEKRKQIWEELNADFLEREKKRLENGEEQPKKKKKEKKPRRNHADFGDAIQDQLKKRTSRINWNVFNRVIEDTKSLFANQDLYCKIEMKEEEDDSLFTEHLTEHQMDGMRRRDESDD